MLNDYIIIINCFSLYLHILTSGIKHIFWLKIFHRQKAGRGHGGQGPQDPAPFQKCAVVQFLKIPVPSLEQQEYSSHLLSYEITQTMTINNPIPWALSPSERVHILTMECVSLNNSIFTLLQLPLQLSPEGSQRPSLGSWSLVLPRLPG